MTSTTDTHPLRELHLFARGEADPGERQRVVRHLLRGCDSCASALRKELAPVADLDALSAAVDRVLERSQALIHQVDDRRAVAIDGLENLETLSAEQQEEWIDRLESLDRRIVCEMLIDRCRDSRHQDASLHLRLAQLAVRAAEAMEDSGREEWTARSLAELGNARRIPGDLVGAERALAQAESVLEAAETEYPTTVADLQVYRAALANDQRRYDEAMGHYELAREMYRQLEDDEAEVGVLIGMGLVQNHRTEPKDGIPYLEEALDRLDPDQTNLLRITLHNLAHLHLDAGDPQTALQFARRARPLFDGNAPRLDRVRFDWLAGRLQGDLGKLEEAAESLQQTRQTYMDENLPYEVALVSLDLAAVYAQRGEREALKTLAGETVGLFRALGIAQESTMALKLLSRVEASEALELVSQLTGVLESRHPRYGAISTADFVGR